jgi:hypothetical protein
MCAKQVELPGIVVTCRRDRLVVTAYLGEVSCLELQGDLHQRVRDVGGGFIGDGILGRMGCARHRRRLRVLVNFVLGAVAPAFDDDRGVAEPSRSAQAMRAASSVRR